MATGRKALGCLSILATVIGISSGSPGGTMSPDDGILKYFMSKSYSPTG
jgi:hypothetical protein